MSSFQFSDQTSKASSQDKEITEGLLQKNVKNLKNDKYDERESFHESDTSEKVKEKETNYTAGNDQDNSPVRNSVLSPSLFKFVK